MHMYIYIYREREREILQDHPRHHGAVLVALAPVLDVDSYINNDMNNNNNNNNSNNNNDRSNNETKLLYFLYLNCVCTESSELR